MIERAVTDEEDGLTALAVLSDELFDVPTAELRRLLELDGVSLNGRPCSAGRKVAAGDLLAVRDEGLERIAPAPLSGFSILHADDDLLGCNKPAGVAVEAERGHQARPLKAALLHHLRGRRSRPRLVHRIDKDTSGVLLVALTRRALAELTRQFEAHEVRKEYLALVRGRVQADEGVVDLPLEVRKRSRSKRAPVRVGGGKAAITRWRVEERFGRHTLLRVFPETGRQHQVRAHLGAIGHPLAVDLRYGGGQALWLSDLKRGYRPGVDGERPLLARVPLHAHRLAVVSLGGEPLRLEAPLPRDMRVALRQLAKYDP